MRLPAVSCSELGLKDRVVVQGYLRRLATEAPQAALASCFFNQEKKKKTFRGASRRLATC